MSTPKLYRSAVLSALVLLTFSACNDKQETKTITSLEDKAGYSIGSQIGKQLLETKDEINREALILGINDALDEKELKVTAQDMQKTMQEFSAKMKAKSMEKMKASGDENKKEG